MSEIVFVLLKPDCLRLGLTENIMKNIKKHGLSIKKNIKVKLKSEDVDFIYQDIINEHFYTDLKNFMMSGDCILLLISGNRAVSLIKKIKYKIREEYSPNKTFLHGTELELWKNNKHPEQSYYNVKLSAENLMHACDSIEESQKCFSYFSKKSIL